MASAVSTPQKKGEGDRDKDADDDDDGISSSSVRDEVCAVAGGDGDISGSTLGERGGDIDPE